MKSALAAALGALLVLAAVCVLAQDEPADDIDRATDLFPTAPFVELRLDEEGVVARDSLGQEWYYDFTQGVFGATAPGDSREDLAEPVGPGEIDPGLPVQQRCTERRVVKPFERGSVTIGYDEFVDGNVIAWGRVTVKGWVKGDVKSINKRVLVYESGWVDGDVEAPEVVIKDGAYVAGGVVEEPVPLKIKDIAAPFSAAGIIVVGIATIVLLLGSFLLTSLMPRHVNNVRECIHNQRAKSFFIGLLMVVLFPVVVLLVIITIVGLLVVPLVPLAYVVAIMLGMITAGGSIGHRLSSSIRAPSQGLTAYALLGILVQMVPWAATALLMGTSSGVAQGFGILALVISIIVTAFPALCGIGAVLLTRFGFRTYAGSTAVRPSRTEGVPAPAPPPIPEPPAASSGPISDGSGATSSDS